MQLIFKLNQYFFFQTGHQEGEVASKGQSANKNKNNERRRIGEGSCSKLKQDYFLLCDIRNEKKDWRCFHTFNFIGAGNWKMPQMGMSSGDKEEGKENTSIIKDGGVVNFVGSLLSALKIFGDHLRAFLFGLATYEASANLLHMVLATVKQHGRQALLGLSFFCCDALFYIIEQPRNPTSLQLACFTVSETPDQLLQLSGKFGGEIGTQQLLLDLPGQLIFVPVFHLQIQGLINL